MNCNSFTITSRNGFYNFPLSEELPFSASISLKGISAQDEIQKLAAQGPLVLPSQVHRIKVVRASKTSLYPQREEADGLLIFPGDPVCALRFADCAPVLILSHAPHPWVLILHSGFHGTLGNIVAQGMALARRECGKILPSEIFAWVGPCISGKCYARQMDDPSTAEALKKFDPDAVHISGSVAYISLKRQIACQLAVEGIPENQIFLESQCTHCETGLFYSHRASKGDGARMLFVLRTKPKNADFKG